MICTVIANQDKWTTVIQSKVIGTSKHKDYSLFHWKAKDVAALKAPITKFVFVDSKGEVEEVIEAEQLKARGCNFKTAKRDDAELSEAEQAEVAAAYKLAYEPTPPVPTAAPKTEEPAPQPAEEQPPQEAPAPQPTEKQQPEAAPTLVDPADAPDFDDPLNEPEAQPALDDPLATMKPSRNKRRH